jgi:lipopolysaccharide/colanic/teichoic acid biosynthesis glycosyltransferase
MWKTSRHSIGEFYSKGKGSELSQPPALQWANTTGILIGDTDRSLYFTCKWLIDVLLATLLLILFLPLMVLIAILIKLDSAGPVFFIQERVGARRRAERRRTIWKIRNFPCYKFRSMIHNADQSLHQNAVRAFIEGRVEGFKGSRAKFKLSNDSRVTRVGRILRKTSLDELPQLFNVLKGEMSLVGPRPVPTYEVAGYQDTHRQRLATLPGITGLWQVKGRCQVSFDEMIRMDVEYVRNQSLFLDIKILFLTFSAVLSGRGAE